MAILTQHITSEPKPLAHVAAQHGKSLPPGMEEIIARCMRKEPEQRFQTMDELVASLVAVYRGVAGAGMSGYMAAHRSGGQAGISGPFQGPTGTIAGSGRPMGHTPMPYAGGHSAPFRREGSVRYPVPQPDPQFTSSMPAATDSGAFPRRKNRIGLFLVLLVVMAAVGSGIALLVLSQTQGGKATAGTNKRRPPEETVVEPPTDLPLVKRTAPVGGTTEPGTTEPGTTDPTGTEPGKTEPGKTDPNGTTPEVAQVADAGATEPGKTEPGKTEPGKTEPGKTEPGKTEPGKDPPRSSLTQVLINSRPQGAVVQGPDGRRLGKTPVNVWVEPGKPLEVTLKLRRHRELKASIDDRKNKVTLKMERVPRPAVDGPGPGAEPVEELDPPDDPKELGPCEEDPSSIDCRCERNPELPECGLE
jgi:hypothetical protein